jgi:hypothetical protein
VRRVRRVRSAVQRSAAQVKVKARGARLHLALESPLQLLATYHSRFTTRDLLTTHHSPLTTHHSPLTTHLALESLLQLLLVPVRPALQRPQHKEHRHLLLPRLLRRPRP